MKRIISLILVAVLAVCSFASCQVNDNGQREKIEIGYMAGPTGMGMAKLIHDNGGKDGNNLYGFHKYADTTLAKKDLASGAIDLICLPTNEAAAYYNANPGSVRVLAINCLNSLYLLTNKNTSVESFDDLGGKTIYTCKNGTPRMVLEHIVEVADIGATVSYTFDGKEIATPADLGALVVSGKLPIAVMPEPIVTSSLLSIQKNGNADISYSVDLDLADAWSKAYSTPITMGCVVASADFVMNNKSSIDAFLRDYEESIEFIGKSENIDTAANYVVETEVMAAAPAAKKALANLGDAISYIDGDDMKNALVSFYDAIGLKKPDDGFYYND